jgi:hypothetical protein
MATTEQRSGFRLPWASDARPGTLMNGHPADPDGDQGPGPDQAPDAERVTETTDPSTAEATEMQETTLPDQHAMTWPNAKPTMGDAESETTAGGEVAESAEAKSAEPAEAESAEAEPAEAEPAAPELEGVSHEEPEASVVTPPDSDAGHASEPGEPAPVGVATRSQVRRDNPLVAGLVRAMRDAAGAAREETATRFAEDAKARIEEIHAHSADEAAELRKEADAEIIEIRDWSKAEMARIREETDERIADRHQRLESDIESHAASVESRIERVQVAITGFERRMDAFFEQLLAEEDPAHLAGLAEQLPEPPSLDGDVVEADESRNGSAAGFPMGVLDARGAEAAEAEAFEGLDPSAAIADGDADDGTSTDAEGVEEIAEEDVVRRLEAFTSPPTPPADAVVTRLAVVGLVSVASIAGFKRALAKVQGVRSVTVASGPSGDFVFTVAHDSDTDLTSVVPALDGFAASITGDADGVLTVTASDPESDH